MRLRPPVLAVPVTWMHLRGKPLACRLCRSGHLFGCGVFNLCVDFAIAVVMFLQNQDRRRMRNWSIKCTCERSMCNFWTNCAHVHFVEQLRLFLLPGFCVQGVFGLLGSLYKITASICALPGRGTCFAKRFKTAWNRAARACYNRVINSV